MTHSSLLRVQVAAPRRRLDVSLPAEVALWEILPEVLRGLGWSHDPSRTVLVTAGGKRLDPERGLLGQDVADGDVLTAAHHEEHRPAVLHDDLVEAVHERSREVLASWGPGSAERAGTLVPLTLVGLVLVVLLVSRLPAGTSAAVGAGALLVLAVTVLMTRAAGPSWAPVAGGWLGVPITMVTGWHASVAGGLGATEATVASGAAAAAVGLVAPVMASSRWPLSTPPLVVMAVWGLAEAVSTTVGPPRWEVLLVVLALGCLVATAVPSFAVGATVTRGQAEGSGVDVARLDADIFLAHRLVLSLQWSGTVLLLTVVPFVVPHGMAATAVLLVVLLVRLLRLRHQRSSTVVATGLVGAGVTVTWLVLHVVLHQPAWLPGVLGVLLAGALLIPLVVVAVPRGASGAWWGWLGDTAETVLVVSLPLTVTVTLAGERWFTW
ncbi:EsaB/YukD family protein [Nocardioides jishulii]|uniref:Type VII secretion integral membrane protein EccD n=1 Tax=Nocardioides jishulii TaxID=2575440 RepID=A0A4U2YS32_9ACTN|nr:EsaB/YukD family protein [Nocardioides jishulii]QCX28846.1 hypothetical protein FCL41_15935 [Nocardioides jishulii]TKI64257.1 hypothetical protein FC770_03630 [Nocardioides jishulii]